MIFFYAAITALIGFGFVKLADVLYDIRPLAYLTITIAMLFFLLAVMLAGAGVAAFMMTGTL